MRKKMPSWGYEFCIYQFFQGRIVTAKKACFEEREKGGVVGGDVTLNRPKEGCVSVNIDK